MSVLPIGRPYHNYQRMSDLFDGRDKDIETRFRHLLDSKNVEYIVFYNGKAVCLFDIQEDQHCIETRTEGWPIIRMCEIDRSKFKNYGHSCSIKTVEQAILELFKSYVARNPKYDGESFSDIEKRGLKYTDFIGKYNTLVISILGAPVLGLEAYTVPISLILSESHLAFRDSE